MKLFPGKTYSLFLVREFLKVFAACILFIMGLSYIVRILQKSDSGKGATVLEAATLHFYDAPAIFFREALLPSCMFASVYAMSTLSKNREILALRSCGVSVYRIITPLIAVGCAISAFSLFGENELLISSYAAKSEFTARMKGQQGSSYLRDRSNIIVFGGNNTVFKIDRFVHKSVEMRGVVILGKDEEGNLSHLTNAEGAVWNGERWVLRNGVRYSFGRDGELGERHVFDTLTTDMRDDPKYFGRDVRKIEDMNLGEAREYIAMHRKMGLSYRNLATKYHKRMAQSASLLFILIIGLSLGSIAFKNALVVSFSITLGFVLVFLFLIEIGTTLGASGALPPVLGGWLGVMVFAVVSVWLLARIRV